MNTGLRVFAVSILLILETNVLNAQYHAGNGPNGLAVSSSASVPISVSSLSSASTLVPTEGGFDQDGIPDDYEAYLAEKYVPHFIFHPNERLYFFDPTLFLNSAGAELNAIFGPWRGSGSEEFDPTGAWSVSCGQTLSHEHWYPPTSSDLITTISHLNSHEISSYPNFNNCVQENGWDGLVLERPSGPEPTCNGSSVYYYPNPDVPVFFLIEKNDEGNLELQYWVFSTFNDTRVTGCFGNHWGDWMHVALIFEYDGFEVMEPPLYVYYSAHAPSDSPYHPRYLFWDDVKKHQGNHPIAMVANGTHELYYQTQSMRWNQGDSYEEESVPFPFGSLNCHAYPFYVTTAAWFFDYYDQVGVGQGFDPVNLVNLGNGDFPNPQTRWMKFGGHWGFGNSTNGGDGPLGSSGAGSRFRQHCIFQQGLDAFLPMFDFWRNLMGDIGWTCIPVNSGESLPNFQSGVLTPLQFLTTRSMCGGPPYSLYVNQAYSGEQGGDVFHPFSNLWLALFLSNLTHTQTIYLKPDIYGDKRVINQPVVIKKWWGLPGNVVIGQ